MTGHHTRNRLIRPGTNTIPYMRAGAARATMGRAGHSSRAATLRTANPQATPQLQQRRPTNAIPYMAGLTAHRASSPSRKTNPIPDMIGYGTQRPTVAQPPRANTIAYIAAAIGPGLRAMPPATNAIPYMRAPRQGSPSG
jgi:hypothetical protein